MVRTASTFLLLCYCAVVADLTLREPSSGEWAFSRLYHWSEVWSGGAITTTGTEALANVALFVPIGLLLVLVLGRLWAAVLVGILGSVFIEVYQAELLPSRVGTPTDVLHNGYGAVIGALLASPYVLVRLRHRFA